MLRQHTTHRPFLIMHIIRKCYLVRLTDKLLHRKPEKRYPTMSSTSELVNKFADFVSNKIATIRKELTMDSSHCNQLNQEEQYVHSALIKFINFQEVTEHEIIKMLLIKLVKNLVNLIQFLQKSFKVVRRLSYL
jgi:hypothetical protein